MAKVGAVINWWKFRDIAMEGWRTGDVGGLHGSRVKWKLFDQRCFQKHP